MSTKFWALHPQGTVVEIVELPADWVPGEDIYTPDLAAHMTDVTGVDPRPAFGWVVKEGGAFEEPTLPEPGPAQRITYKADIYRRCTDAEAEAIEVALAGAPVRQRRLFEESQYLDHADEAFTVMHQAMVGMFGAARADELLAPA